MSSPYNEFLNEKLGLKSDKAAEAFYRRVQHIRLLSGKEKVLEILNKTRPEIVESFLRDFGAELILEWFESELREISTLDHDKSSKRENTALMLSFIELFIKLSIFWLEEMLNGFESPLPDKEQALQLVKEFLHKTVENTSTEIQRIDQSKSLSPKRTPPQDDTCQQTVSTKKKHPQDENIGVGSKILVDNSNASSSSLTVSREEGREVDKRNFNQLNPEVSKAKRCCGPERLVIASEDNHFPVGSSVTSIEKVIESMSRNDNSTPQDQSFLVSKIAYYCYRLGSLEKNG
ncbi:uncharacterized protein LOC141850088 [Brevipalpus obovatus]|uniref:uncharacterized protein LOC141850088 n=1 Tax=Brevipalpus obovatus TaxID=246614 RepID=UPI003D9E8070